MGLQRVGHDGVTFTFFSEVLRVRTSTFEHVSSYQWLREKIRGMDSEAKRILVIWSGGSYTVGGNVNWYSYYGE